VREGNLRAAIAALALTGAGIAAYLTYARYSGTQIACATGGCETVQNSRYALVAGVPVAVIGLAGYLVLLGSAAFRSATAAAVGVGCAAVGLVFGAYLLVAQISLIHAVCQWCVASDAIMTLISIAALWRCLIVLRQTPDARSERPLMPFGTSRRETRA